MYISLTVTAGEGPGSRSVTINVGETPDVGATLRLLTSVIQPILAGLTQPLSPEELKALKDTLAQARESLAGAMGRVPPEVSPGHPSPGPAPPTKGDSHGGTRGGEPGRAGTD